MVSYNREGKVTAVISEIPKKKKWSIQKQVLVTLLVMFLCLFMILYLVFYTSMQRLLIARENDSMVNQAQAAENMLVASSNYLPKITKDWSSWDDTYEFVLGNLDSFEDDNLSEYLFRLYRLNFITVLDMEGNPLFERFYFGEQNKFQPSENDYTELYHRIAPLVLDGYLTESEQGRSGFLAVGEEIVSLSAFPVLRTNESGPPVGVMIMGRLIDEQEMEYIMEGSDIPFQLQVVSDLDLTPVQKSELLEKGQLVVTHQQDAYTYNLFSDFFGEDTLAIFVSQERTLYAQGNLFIISVLGITALCCTLMLYLFLKVMSRIVVTPLRQLVSQVDTLDIETEVSMLDTDYSNTELSSLAQAVNNMLSRIQSSNKTLFYNANYDALTGLSNRISTRKQLNSILELARESGENVYVFFVDLNRFKYINDTLGHSMGDLFIQSVSDRMKEYLRQDIQLIARMGGDEFALIRRKAAEPEDIQYISSKILTVFAHPFFLRDRELDISVSIGSSYFPQDGEDGDTLLKNAEIAMYNAKAQGDNVHMGYFGEMQSVMQKKIDEEKRMRKAIQQNCKEFQIYIQPKVSTKTDAIESGEALIRWVTPQGVVPPIQFIPLAEETGLIIPLSKWVITEACSKNMQLVNAGIPHTISVNIPAQVLLHKDFLNTVEQALSQVGMDPKYLDIEITESTLADDVDRVNKIFSILHSMGVSISVDDFGTGYSSLSYLKKLSVDRIKIDRSFITGVAKDEDDQAIVGAIMAMSKSLHMIITAEGIETVQQYDYFKKMCGDEVQGYLFSKPLPFDEYIEFVKAWKKGKDTNMERIMEQETE